MNMDCREFREIAEAYLSDELLVESNIRVDRHLEACGDCKTRFAAMRRLRRQMSSTVRDSENFRIDRTFAVKLAGELKEGALNRNAGRRFLRPTVVIPAFAVSAVVVGFLWLSPIDISYERMMSLTTILSEKPVIRGVAEVLAGAVGHHRTCAVQKLTLWEATEPSETPERRLFREKILTPLNESGGSDRIRLLSTDDCIFEGKPFVHVILKNGETVVSVFVEKTDPLSPVDGETAATIVSDEADDFRVAAFRKKLQTVLVVSDLSQSENLKFAQALAKAWNRA
jgi:hypothetical protein